MKYNQIKSCSDFLEELDDFDKLALIFIYEKPESFNIDSIKLVLQKQLSEPRMKLHSKKATLLYDY